MSQSPKILIGIPTMGSVHALLMQTILKWVAQRKYAMSVYTSIKTQPVDNARNEIVEEFMKSDCTHLFFIDSDTIPPDDALDKLLALDADIATGITPIIHYDRNRVNDSSGHYKVSNVITMDDERVKADIGVIQAKTAGGSCLLIKREVFQKMSDKPFRFIYSDLKPNDVIMGKSEMFSEDYYFCARALGLGFSIMCDTSIVCRHQKSILF